MTTNVELQADFCVSYATKTYPTAPIGIQLMHARGYAQAVGMFSAAGLLMIRLHEHAEAAR